jgi:hypothetical protein
MNSSRGLTNQAERARSASEASRSNILLKPIVRRLTESTGNFKGPLLRIEVNRPQEFRLVFRHSGANLFSWVIGRNVFIHELPKEVKDVNPAIKVGLELCPTYFPRETSIAFSEPKTIFPNNVVSMGVGIPYIRLKRVAKDFRQFG